MSILLIYSFSLTLSPLFSSLFSLLYAITEENSISDFTKASYVPIFLIEPFKEKLYFKTVKECFKLNYTVKYIYIPHSKL